MYSNNEITACIFSIKNDCCVVNAIKSMGIKYFTVVKTTKELLELKNVDILIVCKYRITEINHVYKEFKGNNKNVKTICIINNNDKIFVNNLISSVCDAVIDNNECNEKCFLDVLMQKLSIFIRIIKMTNNIKSYIFCDRRNNKNMMYDNKYKRRKMDYIEEHFSVL